MTISRKIEGLFRLFRFELPFSAGVCVVLGELLAIGGVPGIGIVAAGFTGYFLVSAAALILNDYFDYEADCVNAPQRPLPSGMVTKRDVVWLFAIVSCAGLLISALLGVVAFVVALIVWIVGILYNWHVKHTGFWGNLFVSFSVGSTFVFGGIAAGEPWAGITWWFGVIAMLIDLAEEIAADAMDEKGDRLVGSRSLAVLYGPSRALAISAAIFILVILISTIPFVWGWLTVIHLVPIAMMDGAILFFTLRLLKSGHINGRQSIRWIYLSCLAAIIVFIVIRVLAHVKNS
jgi:geranylgeranylglycerol-phosphate geranylgeranyltransferase